MTNKITTVDLHQIAAKHTKEVLHPTRYVTDSVAAMKEVIALCTPPASAQDDAKDDITQRLRDNADLDAAEDGNPAVIRLEREAADEIDRLRRALADAPAAGDARDAERWRWVLSHAKNVGFDYQSGRFTTLTIAGRQGDSLVAFVDAAIAAQQGEGDAA